MIESIPSTELKNWLPLFGVILGALIGLVGSLLTHRFNANQAKIKLKSEQQQIAIRTKREKLEELYILLGHWNNMFFSKYLDLRLVMEDQITYNQHLDNVISGKIDKKVDFQRIEMLLNIYGKELLPLYEKVIKLRSNVNDIASKHKSDYKQGSVNGSSYVKPYTDAQFQLGEAIENLKRELASLVQHA